MLDHVKIYSVSQLCRETRLMLEGHFLTLNIQGEISNLSCPASGHIYFTLKDQSAQVQCAMFRIQRRKLGFNPSNGLQVQIKARVSLYEARGNFQLIVEQMEAAGDGLLRQQFEALKRKLENEGLYDETHKKPLPGLASRVGVITSASGAALHDILSVLKARFPLLDVLIYPVTVQGVLAKQEIIDTLSIANQRKDCDVIILARGGGSLEDFQAFNEEQVARAIYQSNIPIVSAIGHEVDFTIADFVADCRAPTPSAAAEMISPDQFEYLSQLKQQKTRLVALHANISTAKQVHLNQLERALNRAHPGMQLQMHAQRLDDYHLRLQFLLSKTIEQKKARLSKLYSQLLSQQATQKIHLYQQHLTSLQHRLTASITQQSSSTQLRFKRAHEALNTLSPLATLSRGYSISQRASDGSFLVNAQQVNIGETINIKLSSGSLLANVEEVYEH